jgi:hypothetical protein
VSNSFNLSLGQKIQLFQFAPGHVTGHFGSVSMTGYTQGGFYNGSTGTLVGLGTYTPASFEAAIATTPNRAAIVKAINMGTSGGVTQYDGGNLMPTVASAMAADPSTVGAVFDRWSPEAYAGISDQMKFATLDNLPDLGGYDRLVPGAPMPSAGSTATASTGRPRLATHRAASATMRSMSASPISSPRRRSAVLWPFGRQFLWHQPVGPHHGQSGRWASRCPSRSTRRCA